MNARTAASRSWNALRAGLTTIINLDQADRRGAPFLSHPGGIHGRGPLPRGGTNVAKRMSRADMADEKVLLSAAVSPIGYELDALARMNARLRAQCEQDVRDRDAVVENAYLEALLVHARCLIEFLIEKEGGDR